jgi:hypothetical protein
MAEIDNVLVELRHRIMRSFEREPQHQETNEERLAMTQSVDAEYQRHGSAAVALRRLAHPERDGGVVVEDDPVAEAINPERGDGVVVEDDPVAEPINPERGDGVVVGDDPISQLFRRLALDMPELMEEVVAFIERRTGELNERDGGAAPRLTECVAPAASVRPAPTPQDDDTGTATITLRFDTQMLARVDAAANRLGISRTAWLHIAAVSAWRADDDRPGHSAVVALRTWSKEAGGPR